MTREEYRAGLARARANGHAVKFGGGASTGYWWACECGAGRGYRPEWPYLVAVPYEDPFARTFDAHTHMLNAAERMVGLKA